ncbi:YrdB family protein [Candidatus Saccharibacteria bacterium]|nr:YrdB family protein [Candidatus Saccharibacteria bacterium]
MEILKSINLAIRFMLEICTLIATGMFGFSLSKNIILRVVLAIVCTAIIAVIWGLFVAPKASQRIELPWRILLEMVVFGIATMSLIRTNHVYLAMVFAIAVIINQILLLICRQ